MAKEFNILTIEDLDSMVKEFSDHSKAIKAGVRKFTKLRVNSRRWQKSKTSSQHKAYWVCISEMKQAFQEKGMLLTEDDIHQTVKREAGYTKMMELPSGHTVMVTKSIADASEDVNSREMNWLIEYMINWTKLNLDYDINLNGSI